MQKIRSISCDLARVWHDTVRYEYKPLSDLLWRTGVNLPVDGDYRFRMLHPNSVTSSTCHTIKAYQNGVLIGEAYYALIGLPQDLR